MREKGFSLLELLVTCAVLGILASMSVAAYAEYRKNAEIAVAKQYMRDAHTALSGIILADITHHMIDKSTFPQYVTTYAPASGTFTDIRHNNNGTESLKDYINAPPGNHYFSASLGSITDRPEVAVYSIALCEYNIYVQYTPDFDPTVSPFTIGTPRRWASSVCD